MRAVQPITLSKKLRKQGKCPQTKAVNISVDIVQQKDKKKKKQKPTLAIKMLAPPSRTIPIVRCAESEHLSHACLS